MSKKHYCDRCKKFLGEELSVDYTFKRRAVLRTYTKEWEFCRKCSKEVWDFAHGVKVAE